MRLPPASRRSTQADIFSALPYPLPDVSKAIEEVKYALDVLKADGIKLATNIGGQYLGAPELDRLFSVLNERKAVVILHPHRPEPVNRQVMKQTPLAMQEYLSETTRAVSIYYDLAGAHSPEVIRMQLTITTPDHLLYGSDYPYVAPQVLTQSLARMKDYLSKGPDLAPFREMILYQNTNQLFK